MNRKIAGYALFTIGCIIVFSIVLFPPALIKNVVAGYLVRLAPDYRVDFVEAELVMPPGVQLRAVQVFYANRHELDAETIRIYPRWFSLLSANPTFGIHMNAYGGAVKGSATIARQSGQPGFAATITGMQIKDIPAIRNRIPAEVSGILAGDISLESDQTSGDLWQANLTLSTGELRLTVPILNQDRFNFSRASATARLKGSYLQLKSCDVKGEQFDAALSGTGTIGKPIENSTLALNGELKPKAGFLGVRQTHNANTLKFQIRGPAQNLQFIF